MSQALKKSPAILIGLFLTVIPFLICIWGPKYMVSSMGLTVTKPTVFLIQRILVWLCLAIIYWYAVKKEREPFLLWEEQKHTILFYAASVILLLLCVFAGSAAISLTIKYLGLNRHSNALQVLNNLNAPLKLLAVITAAVVEELVFRGYLLSRLQLYFKGAFWPVAISAIIFGLLHFSYGTLANVLVPIFIGAIFAWHYQKYRNLKILIICHFLIDFFALFIQLQK